MAHTGLGKHTRSVLIHDLYTTLDCRWLFNCCGVVHVLLAVASGLLLLLHHNRLAGTEKDRAKKLADRCTSLSFSVAWGVKTKLHAAASWCARTYCAVRGVHCAARAARKNGPRESAPGATVWAREAPPPTSVAAWRVFPRRTRRAERARHQREG